jgi:hypothetical protein
MEKDALVVFADVPLTLVKSDPPRPVICVYVSKLADDLIEMATRTGILPMP